MARNYDIFRKVMVSDSSSGDDDTDDIEKSVFLNFYNKQQAFLSLFAWF